MNFKSLVVVLACLQFAACETYDKVNLTYIYETLCPWCIQFVNEQLNPGYKQLSDYINLELIPVTYPQGTIDTVCSDGGNLCFISEAHACAFERPGVTNALRVEYIACTEAPVAKGETVVDADIEACVNSILKDVVSYETVKTCMDKNESFPTLVAYNDRSNAYGVEYFPWIDLFQVHDAAEENRIRSNFVQEICTKLSNPPAVCSNSGRTCLLH